MVDKIIPPRRGQELTPQGRPTVRFSEYLERLSQVTNETAETASLSISVAAAKLAAQLNSLEDRIGSGDFLTSDETGFTVDSDRLSADQDEA